VANYLLLNGIEPRWRLHEGIVPDDLENSLIQVMENGTVATAIVTLDEGETFRSLHINGRSLVTFLITNGEDNPEPYTAGPSY